VIAAQAKMMLIMPFISSRSCPQPASGLVLYWTVSNIPDVQQKLMDRPARTGAAREAKDAARA